MRAWFKCDNHWYQDADIQVAGDAVRDAAETVGAVVFGVFSVLLAMAKAQNDGGKVRFTYRNLSHELCSDWDRDLRPAVEALVSAGVLTCPESSDRDATVAFKPDSWRRYSEVERKTAKRDGES